MITTLKICPILLQSGITTVKLNHTKTNKKLKINRAELFPSNRASPELL
jgi:hypothetical protein